MVCDKKLYDTLGVPQGASKEDLRKAYKKLAVQHHPDKGGDADTFKEISHAYDVLSDDNKRQVYDQVGDADFNDAMSGGGQAAAHMDPHDIFQQMFNNFGGFGFAGHHQHHRSPSNTKRADHVHNLTITLDQAYTGLTKNMKIITNKPCLTCMATCNTCQGVGSITDMVRMGPFTQMMTRACHTCKGKGKQKINNAACVNCKGAGNINSEHIHDIKIPAGVLTGFNVRISGLGEQPQDTSDIPGDMVIQIQVEEHPQFKRIGKKGRDLQFKHTISFAETIVGKVFIVPHFAGPFKVDTTTLGIIAPGKEYVISSKGMQKGDLHITFDVSYPTDRILTTDDINAMRAALSRCGLLSTAQN